MHDCYPIPEVFIAKKSIEEFNIDPGPLAVITHTLLDVFREAHWTADKDQFCLDMLNHAYAIASKIAYDDNAYLRLDKYRGEAMRIVCKYSIDHQGFRSEDISHLHDALMSIVLLLISGEKADRPLRPDEKADRPLRLNILRGMCSFDTWKALRMRWFQLHHKEQGPSGEVDDDVDLPMNPEADFVIAHRKLTSVLVVLEAMYNAGWIKREDGKKGSRDIFLHDMIYRLFGQSVTGIRQALSAVRNRNYKTKREYLEDLLSHIPEK